MPASQLSGPVIATANAAATVASAETKALFPAGECDDVYELRFFGEGGPGTPYLVQPGGEYQPTIAFDAPWGDAPVQAIAIKPLIDNKKVTHHYLLTGVGGSFNVLDVWGPGSDDPPLPADVGIDLPHGASALRFNMHYYNLAGTKPEPDRSGVAICVVRGAKLRKNTAAVTVFAAVGAPMVPANAKGHVLTNSCKATLKEPVTLLSLWPHAHKRARHMKLTVTKPDGRLQTLHDGSFSFEEQASYPVSPAYLVEDGDTFTTTCTYDNDSNRNISFGENTDDEMCFNFAVAYPKGALRCGFGGGPAGAFPPGFNPFGDGGLPPGFPGFGDGGFPAGFNPFGGGARGPLDGGVPLSAPLPASKD
ncbi:MAG: hypothetical protein ABW252_11665 [Polyangiales bacterium]